MACLTVLGSCGAWPEPGRACSGYVLEHAGFRLVLDLGYGTATRLLAHVGSRSGDGVDAVVISHEHPDHMLDLHALFRARWFGHREGPPISLYAPPGVMAVLADLEDDEGALEHVFTHHPLPSGGYDVGPFRLESRLLPHFVPNVGVRLTAPGLTVAYTGDTGPDPAVRELARNADLMIAEATDRSQQKDSPPATSANLHLSARQAGVAAAAAGARRLLLTHFWPGNDRDRSRTDARDVFDGEVLLAEEGLAVALP
ncbi:MBL fold metallo-hydrolase [Georgenia deserti]|uniref:MBL fold metallo-hydrolase n=1 Tax=Georgenia deserti TaxID=2093781 RepID=A0ABW4L8W9_9MICO